MNDNSPPQAIVVAPYWPTGTFGGNLADRASLLAYLQTFAKVHYIWVADENWNAGKAYPDSHAERILEWNKYNIDFHHIPLRSQPAWLRFIKSIPSSSPAITFQYATVSKQLVELIQKIVLNNTGRKVLIFEDIPSAFSLIRIRQAGIDIPVAIRSHNVASQVFESLSCSKNILKNLLWKYEINKIYRYERHICSLAEMVWPISQQDVDEYKSKLNISTNGIIGTCLDTEKYNQVPDGDPHTVVSVGRVDLRKGQGWDLFIDKIWSAVREKVPSAKLVIAGVGSEKYNNSALGITGLGYVKDEREVLAMGRIFLNPQRSGSGIKLKSIVAMLAGKVLISTKTGLQGVVGKDGEHFLLAETQADFVEHIRQMGTNPEKARLISHNARKIAKQTYGIDYFLKDVSPLLREFGSLSNSS